MKRDLPGFCDSETGGISMRGAWTIALVLLASVTVFLAFHSPPDPAYNGKTLSQWVDRASAGPGGWTPDAERELDQAVSHLGPRALPILVSKIGEERWLDQGRLFVLQRRLPRSLQNSSLFRMLQRRVADKETRAQSRSFVAARALAELGTNAQPALPALMRLFRRQDSVSFSVSYAVSDVLVRLGKPAFREILNCLSDPKFARPELAVQLLGRMRGLGADAAEAVPILCRRVRQGNSALAVACADALGRLGARPALAVPVLCEVLTNALQNPDVLLSRKCAEALGEFGLSASNAVPVLCAALNSGDGITTEEAARALGRIGAGQDLAVPALLDYLKRNGSRHRRFAIEGLCGYRAAGPLVLPSLRAALEDEDHDTRALAQQALERFSSLEPEPAHSQ